MQNIYVYYSVKVALKYPEIPGIFFEDFAATLYGEVTAKSFGLAGNCQSLPASALTWKCPEKRKLDGFCGFFGKLPQAIPRLLKLFGKKIQNYYFFEKKTRNLWKEMGNKEPRTEPRTGFWDHKNRKRTEPVDFEIRRTEPSVFRKPEPLHP